MQGIETLDDARTTRGGRLAQPGIVVVFCARIPTFRWGALDAQGVLKLGRGPLLGLELDGRMSREHAEISARNGGPGADLVWTIADLGSRNGTYVDGIPIHGSFVCKAKPRVVRLGHTLVIPMIDGWAAVTAPALRQADLVVGPTLRSALVAVERAAAAGQNALITGESGSGKELAAKSFHAASPHRHGPLISVNCAAIPQGVAERLLFGAKRGAYSGANTDVDGYLQSAHNGVLFLDELGELDLEVQAKLLRAVETKEVLPLGATQSRRVDVHFCFATHKDLRQLVADGKFRSDLYYRINQPEIVLPPLRARLEEIPWHVAGEIERIDPQLHASAELIEACMLRVWPGNVRELRGEVRRMAHAALEGPSRTLRPEHLSATAGMPVGIKATMSPPAVPESARASSIPLPFLADSTPSSPTMPAKRAEITKERLEAAFREHANATGVARALGIHRSHLYRLMKLHGFSGPKEEPDGTQSR